MSKAQLGAMPTCVGSQNAHGMQQIYDDNDDSIDNVESDGDEDRKSQQSGINLSAIANKDQVPLKVKCWDCSNIVSTSKFLMSK